MENYKIMAANYITQVELGKLLGVDKNIISQAIRAGNLNKGHNSQVDLNDPLTQQFMIRRGEMFKPNDRPLSQRKTEAEIIKLELDHTIRKIKIDQMEGKLIDKSQVAKVLFYYLEALNINLLETPGVMIDKLTDMVKSGAKRATLEDYIRDIISREINSTKKQIVDRLKNE